MPVPGSGTAGNAQPVSHQPNTEIEEYLKRNDIIFIPVGNVEVHGGLPTDCEYVGPLAFAQKVAEEADGLVFPLSKLLIGIKEQSRRAPKQ